MCTEYLVGPNASILKYDPINDITSFLGEEDYGDFKCEGNGALARVGRDECTCIYALVRIFNLYRNPRCQALKIDTTNNSRCFVGNFIHSDYPKSQVEKWLV